MLLIAFLLIPFIALLAQVFGWQADSFDLNDPEAARAKYADITAIESFSEQGRAWCSLTEREVRAIARHTEMSNIVTTTTHTSSAGEVSTNAIVEPAPNQDELVEGAVKQTSDSCRYNVWANIEKLQTVTDEEGWAELLCQLTREEATTLIRFLSVGGYTEVIEVATSSDGSSTETKVSRPPERVDESDVAAGLEELSAECGWEGGQERP
ncbi:MAG: hypothetical protein F4X66_05295 [Chloroflexi bacterium]|nr:hypothetical protein [Chloroflexota bacterium]MYE42115.1 hypothetical protein [Chloroflexota bacterium]